MPETNDGGGYDCKQTQYEESYPDEFEHAHAYHGKDRKYGDTHAHTRRAKSYFSAHKISRFSVQRPHNRPG